MAGSFSATVGSDDDYRAKGWVSMPLTSTLSFRAGGGYATYDGWGKNAANPGNNLGGYEKYAYSGALEFKPTDYFRVVASGFATHSKNEITPVAALPLSSLNCGNASGGLFLLFCGNLPASRVSDISAYIPPTEQSNGQGSLLLEGKFWNMKATSVSGFTFGDNRGTNDYDLSSSGTLFGVCTLGNATNASCGANFLAAPYTRLTRINLWTSNAERIRTVSQELRLQSDTSGPFQWLIGGFYSNSRVPLNGIGIGADASGLAANERLIQVSQLGNATPTGLGAYDFTANPYLIPTAGSPVVVASYSAAGTITRSIFGSLGYRLGDLRVNVEGRYNVDDKKAQVFSINNPASAPGIYRQISGTSVPGTGVFPVAGPIFTKSFKSFTPRVTADYQLTPDVMFFASAAKGVRSGGFNTANPVSATGILASEVAYKEEANWTYEAGVKTRFFSDRLDFDVSYFHVDWDDAQISSFTANPTALTPVRIVQNAGKIVSNGVEAKADLALTERYSVGGSIVYSDPHFLAGAYDGSQISQCRVGVAPNFTSAPGCPRIIAVPTANGGTQYVPSLEGLRAQRSVKLQWNLHGTANVPLTGNWVGTARIDVNHNGSAFNNLMNTQIFGERTLTNLRVGVDDGKYFFALWATNLFDVTYAQNAINQPRAGLPFTISLPEIVLGETRRVGFTGTVKF
jgi:iron complex outermembrane receptor protein